MFKDWWRENSLFVYLFCFAVGLAYVCFLAIKHDKEVYAEKFNKCMNDIHNVYVCETWARGKDVEIIYMPVSQ